MTDSPLATFDSRHVMRHVRIYPHPIERVFEAVSTAEHLDAWMVPMCRVERGLGGAWAFTFGGDDLSQASRGTIVAWDPPRLVDYGGMRFELEPVEGGTRLTYLQSMPKDLVGKADEQFGGDLPGGLDTGWRPGFVAGFHLMLDDLVGYLDGDGGHKPRGDATWRSLVDVYRAHIRETIPSA